LTRKAEERQQNRDGQSTGGLLQGVRNFRSPVGRALLLRLVLYDRVIIPHLECAHALDVRLILPRKDIGLAADHEQSLEPVRFEPFVLMGRYKYP
jgi:hypothetical protein